MSAYIFDSETTGMVEPEVIQTALLQMGERPGDPATDGPLQHFRPTKPIELGALSTHHIMDEELAAFPPSASFRLPGDCTHLIGHNIDFDWTAIGKPPVKRICTLAMARSFWPHLACHGQGALLYHLERGNARDLLKNAHNALADARNCYYVLQHLLRAMNKTVETWEQLWKVSELARIPTVLPMGKHKGMAFTAVPRSYLQWIMREPDMDPYVKIAAKAAL